MTVSNVSKTKSQKPTLNKKSPNKENGKVKNVLQQNADLKRPRVIAVKNLKNAEVRELVKNVSKENAGRIAKKNEVKTEQQKSMMEIEPSVIKELVNDVSSKPALKSSKSKSMDDVKQGKDETAIDKVKKNLKRKHETDKGTNKPKTPEIKEEKTEDAVSPKRNLKRKHPGQKSATETSKLEATSTKKAPVKVNKKTTKESKLKPVKTENSTENENNSNEVTPQKLSKEHILECIAAVFHLTEEQMKDDKSMLFAEDPHPIFMQVTCLRIPKTPRRRLRILLPHSLVSANDEVALIVGDLEKGRKKDYEPTIEHYQNLLQQHGITCVNNIIPMNQVKTEYDQFELKRKLIGSYDFFLVDGKICGHISHLLGKLFYEKRKIPTPIRMNSKDLKHEIDHALSKTSMDMHSKGNTHVIQVGTTRMTKKEILENILAACKNLKINYPGGWNNIKALRIKGATTLSVPIYITLKNKNKVEVPEVHPRRPKAYQTVKGELSTISGDATVIVTPEGDIQVDVVRDSKNQEENTEDDDMSESDQEENSN